MTVCIDYEKKEILFSTLGIDRSLSSLIQDIPELNRANEIATIRLTGLTVRTLQSKKNFLNFFDYPWF